MRARSIEIIRIPKLGQQFIIKSKQLLKCINIELDALGLGEREQVQCARECVCVHNEESCHQQFRKSSKSNAVCHVRFVCIAPLF